jgi:hypothetical protein
LIVNTKLHVANLSSIATATELRDLFSAYGNVAEVNLSVERESRPPRRLKPSVSAQAHFKSKAFNVADHQQVAKTWTMGIERMIPPSFCRSHE